MLNFFKKISQNFSLLRVLVVTHDLTVTAIALSLAYILRFDGPSLTQEAPKLLKILPFIVAYAGMVYALFSLYAAKWRFASLPDMINIAKAVTVILLTLIVLDYGFTAKSLYGELYLGKKTIFIYAILQILLLASSRLFYRYYKSQNRQLSQEERNLIVIARAGDVEFVARGVELKLYHGKIIGYISPLEKDYKMEVRGIKSIGRINDMERVISSSTLRGLPIHEAIVVTDSLTQDQESFEFLGVLRRKGILIKTLKLSEDENSFKDKKHFLHKVHDEELLLRSLIKIDSLPLLSMLKGKSVMITGGGGSIGSEITLRVAHLGAKEVTIVENSEPTLYSILERLELEELPVKTNGVIGDIRDKARIKAIFNEYKPDFVFHAAALKHVPYLEEAPVEAVKTNVFGTKNVADAAREAGVEAFVLISTDKATRPASILGATKNLAELYVQMLDSLPPLHGNQQRFLAVRFGNVLASSGSVVPRFIKQIENGGPITVTDKNMVRYFMTVREATDLVLTASQHGLQDEEKKASVYVLNMGQPVRIYDLAERLIRMAGFTPNVDIKIDITGMRAGERLNEELFTSDEPLVDVGIAGMVAAEKNPMSGEVMNRIINELMILSEKEQNDEIKLRLAAIVPGYKPAKIVPIKPIDSSLLKNEMKSI